MRPPLRRSAPTILAALMLFALALAEPAAGGDPSPRGPYARWRNGPDDDSFPIAVWLQAPRNAPRYRAIGINLYVGLWKGPTEEQLAELERHGMRVICSQNTFARSQLDRRVIAGWMHGDEPDNAQSLGEGKGWGPPVLPARIVEGYHRIRSADPSRPVLLNLGQAVAWDGWHGRGVRTRHPEDYPEYVKGSDIASFDIYPAVHSHPDVAGKLWYVARGVRRLGSWAGEDRVVWNCIECTRISNVDVEPTPRQVKAEVWMALVNGSQGIIYFCHQFRPRFVEAGLLANEEMAAAVGAINHQVQELAPVLRARTTPRRVTLETDPPHLAPPVAKALGSTAPVACLVKDHAGATWIFAVEMQGRPTRATFRLEGAAATAKRAIVLGEERSVVVSSARFRDAFEPWGVHLYRVE